MTRSLSIVYTVIALALALACARFSPAEAPMAQLDGASVLVMPFNLAIRRAPELDRASTEVGAEFVEVLLGRGAEVSVLAPEDALELWGEAFEAVGPNAGLEATTQRFVALLAEEAEFDLLVMPSLVVRGATVAGEQASWDGVRRDLPMNRRVIDTPELEQVRVRGLTGTVVAASLHLVALQLDGMVVFEGLAGLDVLQKAHRAEDRMGDWRLQVHEEPLRDLDHLREGIELAFERRLPQTARAW